MSKIDTTYQTLDEIEGFTLADLHSAEATLEEIKAGTYRRTEMDDELDALFPDRDIEQAQISTILKIKQALANIADARSAGQ